MKGQEDPIIFVVSVKGRGTNVSRIPEFLEALKKMEDIHVKKNEDYATESDPLSNFTHSSYLGSLFNKDRDKAFAILIGTKLGRLSSLLNSSNTPNNESIEDTLIDCANYMLLWRADFMRRTKKLPPSIAKILAASEHYDSGTSSNKARQ